MAAPYETRSRGRVQKSEQGRGAAGRSDVDETFASQVGHEGARASATKAGFQKVGDHVQDERVEVKSKFNAQADAHNTEAIGKEGAALEMDD